jgi:hypothetical protein
MHTGEVRGYGYVAAVLSGSASTAPYRLYINFAVRRDYSSPAARALRRLRRAPRLLISGRTCSTSTSPCATTTHLRPHALCVDLAVHCDYSSPAARALRRPRCALRLLVFSRTRSTSTSPCTATTRLHSPGCSDLPRLRRTSGCLGASRGSSRGSSRRSLSTTLGPSSTTSPPPRVRVPRHVARLVAWLVARLVVDYFAYAVRPGASARRTARHTAHRRLLRAPQLRLAAALALLQPCRAS